MHLHLLVFALTVVTMVMGHVTFQCEDGSTVALRLVCDGIRNCNDGSDETYKACARSRCGSGRWFRCHYGACILRSKVCDGKEDCADASDEANCPGISCNLSEHRCKSGVCVPLRAACNGTAECLDKSDETPQLCAAFKCDGSAFQCAYGACIPSSLLCDDVDHCADGSDESSPFCELGCKVPEVAPPLQTQIVGCKSTQICSSNIVPDLGALSFSCPQDFALQGEAFAFCVRRHFQPPQIPKCVSISGEGMCPDLHEVTPDLEVTCTLRSEEMTSCKRTMPVGTKATFQCLQNSMQRSEAICMDGGIWSEDPPICEPKCGIANPESYHTRTASTAVTTPGITSNIGLTPSLYPTWARPGTSAGISTNIGLAVSPRFVRTTMSTSAGPLIVHGTDAFPGQWPWQAALFYDSQVSANSSEYKYQCGGTLVSDVAVVTAAHCVYRRNVTRLRIVLGKFERAYDESEPDVQYMKIRKVYIPETYLGAINFYDSDIAVLGLEDKVNFTANVRPSCLDWQGDNSKLQLVEDNEAVLAGWGYTENYTEAGSLRYTKLQFIPLSKCVTLVPADFKKFLRVSTFCAGTSNGTSACNGDSGGGLHFPLGPETPTTPWLLQGVVSLSIRQPSNVICDPSYPTVFTKVVNFIEFVVQSMKQAARVEEWTARN